MNLDVKLDVCEVIAAIAVLNKACDIDVYDSVKPLQNALGGLVTAARRLVQREDTAKNGCIIRVTRVKKAHKKNGRVGGMLLPVKVDSSDAKETLLNPQRCYVCKEFYYKLHFFYDSMCLKCAFFNYAKRMQTGDLRGKRAIVTGGRIKIGFQIALKLLRAGATVVVTTRFPRDALKLYKQQDDWNDWETRLTIYQLDFLNGRKLLMFCQKMASEPLHILINNAAQTIARPDSFYHDLLKSEGDKPSLDLNRLEGDDRQYFPSGQVDENGIQVDLRPKNTWDTRLEETPFKELLDVTAINYIGPYVLMKQLHPALLRAEPRSFVVNVSAMEGNYRCHKTGYHAHTNGAKAALNMLTRTVGRVWADQEIYVTSVDTGWITNEYPIKPGDSPNRYHPPLDEVDGAARVLDPIFAAGETPSYGVFLKDYKQRFW